MANKAEKDLSILLRTEPGAHPSGHFMQARESEAATPSATQE